MKHKTNTYYVSFYIFASIAMIPISGFIIWLLKCAIDTDHRIACLVFSFMLCCLLGVSSFALFMAYKESRTVVFYDDGIHIFTPSGKKELKIIPWEKCKTIVVGQSRGSGLLVPSIIFSQLDRVSEREIPKRYFLVMRYSPEAYADLVKVYPADQIRNKDLVPRLDEKLKKSAEEIEKIMNKRKKKTDR